jgi:hypothetical protein
MARDPRKNSAFDSGMRGREKPKVQEAHGSTKVNDNAGGENKQGAGKTIGTPGGVDLSAYSSGMRGIEKPKQKSAADGATYGQGKEGAGGGENKQAPDTRVGNPDGHNDAARGKRHGVDEGGMRNAGSDAKKLGIPGNNTEEASQSAHPEGEAGILGDEDDTHINLRIPKASLKKKNPGLQTN